MWQWLRGLQAKLGACEIARDESEHDLSVAVSKKRLFNGVESETEIITSELDNVSIVAEMLIIVRIDEHSKVFDFSQLRLAFHWVLQHYARMPLKLAHQINTSNISKTVYATHSVFSRTISPYRKGIVLGVSSVTGLETLNFPGEAVYHANKASIQASSISLRMRTSGTNIRVMVTRPRVLHTHFHLQRVRYDQGFGYSRK